ncbi:unnamed protein product [Rotaria magnacalcarata]|nr:unnamed protein product [Rotaria magnacalcarata]
MFRIVKFVESKKEGPVIPLYNTTDRLEAMLGIGKTTVFKLRSEMRVLEEDDKHVGEDEVVLRRRTVPDVSASPKRSRRKRKLSFEYSDREFTEKEGYQFHVLLSEKIYPTTEKLLKRLQLNNPMFPIPSETSLWRSMKRLGFEYKRISKVSTPLDSVSFVAQRAKYFARLDEVRSNGSLIFYHDETWANSGEEKRVTWFDPNTGSGRLRNNDARGARIAISALLGENGFHLASVDIFKCQEEHNMDGDHFLQWMLQTALFLRLEHDTVILLMTLSSTDFMKLSGLSAKICIIIDNATWHNRLAEETKPPKRAWNKATIIDWLNTHQIKYPEHATKAQLLDIAFENVPEKKYIVDEAVKIYDIQIIRLPIKHCSLNPIELAWGAMKSYIRQNNTSFRLSDVERLASEWMTALDSSTAQSYIEHAQKYELVFRQADAFAEELEEQIKDENDEIDLSEDGEIELSEDAVA